MLASQADVQSCAFRFCWLVLLSVAYLLHSSITGVRFATSRWRFGLIILGSDGHISHDSIGGQYTRHLVMYLYLVVYAKYPFAKHRRHIVYILACRRVVKWRSSRPSAH